MKSRIMKLCFDDGLMKGLSWTRQFHKLHKPIVKAKFHDPRFHETCFLKRVKFHKLTAVKHLRDRSQPHLCFCVHARKIAR